MRELFTNFSNTFCSRNPPIGKCISRLSPKQILGAILLHLTPGGSSGACSIDEGDSDLMKGYGCLCIYAPANLLYAYRHLQRSAYLLNCRQQGTEVRIALRLENLLHAVQMQNKPVRLRYLYRSAADIDAKAIIKLYSSKVGDYRYIWRIPTN
ncbi:hypothetical protein D3C78_1376160 [compost metagenome]